MIQDLVTPVGSMFWGREASGGEALLNGASWCVLSSSSRQIRGIMADGHSPGFVDSMSFAAWDRQELV